MVRLEVRFLMGAFSCLPGLPGFRPVDRLAGQVEHFPRTS